MDASDVVIEKTYYECTLKKERHSAEPESGVEAKRRSSGEEECETWQREDEELREHGFEEDGGFFFSEDDGEDEDDEGAEDGLDEDDFEMPCHQARHNKALGKRGEDAAARYLEHMEYEILDRNWTCPAGEADIVAREGHTLVFVEVKTRTNINKGFPSEAVDARKRARYEKIAAWYLRSYDELDVPVRFDVIALLVIGPDRAFMKHYVNAFGVER